MIKKILSGGKTGVDQAAVDIAIKLDISHSRPDMDEHKSKEGSVSHKSHLESIPPPGYANVCKQNVIIAEGTLIVARGELTGGSLYTRDLAIQHHRPWLCIDLSQTAGFTAAMNINKWIQGNSIEILNVAGPQKYKEPQIYQAALKLLEAVYYLGMVKMSFPVFSTSGGAGQAKVPQKLPHLPATVHEAVEQIISGLPLKERIIIANMTKGELGVLDPLLGEFIRNTFRLWSANEKLMASCRLYARKRAFDPDDAAFVIIEALWEKLRKTHKLRIVK
ncbi:YpsA SLOG family protein [Thermodesulfobacteriota bacterium]